ncbi:MAG: translation elongation factor-like protein [Candidatus Bathyarchaeia archaeon]
MAENLVGRVINYFSKISVAAINLNEGDLKLGDRIRIRGSTTDLTQTVDSMQINKVPVTIAEKGSSVGIKVQDRVRPGDEVYKILE